MEFSSSKNSIGKVWANIVKALLFPVQRVKSSGNSVFISKMHWCKYSTVRAVVALYNVKGHVIFRRFRPWTIEKLGAAVDAFYISHYDHFIKEEGGTLLLVVNGLKCLFGRASLSIDTVLFERETIKWKECIGAVKVVKQISRRGSTLLRPSEAK